MKVCILVRHTLCDGNSQENLTVQGVALAETLGRSLHAYVKGMRCHLVTSPALRAQHTQRVLAKIFQQGGASSLSRDIWPALEIPAGEIQCDELLRAIERAPACDVLVCVTHDLVIKAFVPYFRAHKCSCHDACAFAPLLPADAVIIECEGGVWKHFSPRNELSG